MGKESSLVCDEKLSLHRFEGLQNEEIEGMKENFVVIQFVLFCFVLVCFFFFFLQKHIG